MSNPSLLLQIAVVLASCRLATPLFAKLGQPPVIAEMMVEHLLGPSCFGWVAPQRSALLFPSSSFPALSMISQIGLVLFMFLIGWRLDVGHLRTIGHLARSSSNDPNDPNAYNRFVSRRRRSSDVPPRSAAARLALAERLYLDFCALTRYRRPRAFARSFESFAAYERWRRDRRNPWY